MCVLCSWFSANKDVDKASSPHGKFCNCVINDCVYWHCIAYMMICVMFWLLLLLLAFCSNWCDVYWALTVVLLLYCVRSVHSVRSVLCAFLLSAFTHPLVFFFLVYPLSYLPIFSVNSDSITSFWSPMFCLQVPGSSAAGLGLCDMFDIRLFSSYHIN